LKWSCKQLPKQPCKDFQPAQKLTIKLLKHGGSLVFHALDDNEDLLYPQYDPFQLKEKEFMKYFNVHLVLKWSIYHHSVTIECHLLSTKSIKELKTLTTEETMLLNWLKMNKIFLEADTLGRKTIQTLGYLFFIHLQVTHHVLLKGILQEAITNVKLSKNEVEAIDPDALEYYPYTELNTDPATDMTNNDQEAYDTDNSKLVPVPFKLFRTDRSYGTGTTRVATKAIGIKSNVTYGKIFK